MTEVEYLAKITATKDIDLQTLLLKRKKERKKERRKEKGNIRFHHYTSLHTLLLLFSQGIRGSK